jgi:hypothetical protein
MGKALTWQSVISLLSSTKVPPANKLRLAALYALRYQKLTGNAIPQVVDTLIANGVSANRARLVYVLLNLAGADQRQDDLFMNENLFSRGKSALRGLKVRYRFIASARTHGRRVSRTFTLSIPRICQRRWICC